MQAAQERLLEFATRPDDAFAGIRFLSLQRSDAVVVRAATAKIVEDLAKLLQDNELITPLLLEWHPHRFASVAAYVYIFLEDPSSTASRWNCLLKPKRMYTPIDQIQSLPDLASHCPPSAAMLGVDAVLTRVEGTHGQAFATPPVVCDLCHKGFRSKEALVDHCKGIHGG